MGKYTIYSGRVDAYIEKEYLQKIIASFKQDIGENLIAIILFGGFGKGEGSVEVIKGKPIPYNDFDFYVVTREKLGDEMLDSISHRASATIDRGGQEIAHHPEQGYDSKKFFHVDVRSLPLDMLPNLMKTQRYYELKNRSIVIFGDTTVLDRIPMIKPDEIPLSEGLRNLFNKLHTMLLGLQPSYSDDQRKIKIFWSYKTYLAICESLLLLNRRFAPSAFERDELFSEVYRKEFPVLYTRNPSLAKKVDKATLFKLKLDFSADHDLLWHEATKDILEIFHFFIEKMTGEEDIVKAIYEKLPYTYFKPYLEQKIGWNFFPSQYLLNLGYVGVLKKSEGLYLKPLLHWKDVGLRMILPIYYLLKHTLEKDEQKKQEYLDKAYHELKQFIAVEKKEFWHLRERALKAYGLYYQQRLL